MQERRLLAAAGYGAMTARMSGLWRVGILRTLLSRLRLVIRLVREPRVPLLTKAMLLLAVLYVIWPLDFVPDLVPLLGQLDDLGIIMVGLEIFVRLCPPVAVAFHSAAITARRRYAPMPSTHDIIDAEWRREP